MQRGFGVEKAVLSKLVSSGGRVNMRKKCFLQAMNKPPKYTASAGDGNRYSNNFQRRIGQQNI